MEMGIIGLGRMGSGIVYRLVKANHKVAGFNRTTSKVDEIVKEGAVGAYSIKELVEKLRPPRVIWLMVPAGKPTEEMLEEVVPHLQGEDIVIDGGNSRYTDTTRRALKLKSMNLFFLDCGTSGGLVGKEQGYCLMVGGEKKAFDRVKPLLEAIAMPGGLAHVGSHGAGHFVKMVHNAIEYGMMQAMGEGFELLKNSPYPDMNFHQISSLWNHGSIIKSRLLEWMEKAFEEDATLSEIKDFVEDNGEGKWAIEEALNFQVPFLVNTFALFARYGSRQDESFAMKCVAALRKQFGGHAVKEK